MINIPGDKRGDMDAALDRLIPAAMQDLNVPGLSLAVIQDRRITLARGYGCLKEGEKRPVDEHSLFGIASITKTFTATALAMLVDEGRLDWDRRVADLMPGFELFDPFASREITVRDLLRHNSGLREVAGGTLWYGSGYSRAEVIRRLRYLKPVSSFRSRYAYQNVMFLVAGELIPALTGISWDDFLRRRIFDPLGMVRTTSTVTELALRDNVALPHAPLRGIQQPVPVRSHDNVGPAASINTSAAELARYAVFYLNQGVFEGRRLVRAATLAQLTEPQTIIPVDEDMPFSSALFNAYGLGWHIRYQYGRKIIFHAGGVDGYRTLLTLVPADGLGIIALSNSESPIAHLVTLRLLVHLLQGQPLSWPAEYKRMSAEMQENEARAYRRRFEGRVTGTRPSHPLAEYAGCYEDPAYGEITVSLEDGGLVLRFSQTPAFTADLSHWHYDTFRLTWRDPYIPDGLLAFQFDTRGRVIGMTFDQPNLLDVDFRELDVRRAED